MISRAEFDGLFDFLACNNWKFASSKSIMDNRRHVYYEKLKHCNYAHLKKACDNIFDAKDQERFPDVQRIKEELANIVYQQSLRKKIDKKPDKQQRTLNRLFIRMTKQAKYIIEKYGNDKARLQECSRVYEGFRCKIKGEHPSGAAVKYFY